jgi:hypothetical protein
VATNKKSATCSHCPTPIYANNSKTGMCRACFDNSKKKVRPDTATPSQERVEQSGDVCEVTKQTSERVRTLEDLIRVCEIDTTEWDVERFLCNKWEMAMAPKTVGSSKSWSRQSTDPIITPIYQVKAWLRRKVAVIAAKSEIEALKDQAKSEIVRAFAPAIVQASGGHMLEIDIFDLHAGKLAWSKETGWDNYDTKIAIQLYNHALEALIERTAGYPIEEILLVTGNDLLNSDNPEGTTTRGTPQDSDGRFHKTFGLVRQMIVTAIERLRTIAPVVVPMIPGNHDKMAVWHLGDSLECYFHRAPGVRIDNAPRQRKYHEFGKVMLMLTHGDKGKHPDYPLLMATEEPKMFGRTLYREAHIGHRHEGKLREFHGVRVRTLSALCAPDAWHSEEQYVGNQREAQAFVWGREDGLMSTAFYNVPQER